MRRRHISSDWLVYAGAASLVPLSVAGSLPFSTLESLGFATGAISVWLVVRASVWTWPVGMANNEAYTGTAAVALEELALTRRYDLYLLCALDVPFVQDGWRDDGPHRPALDAALRRYLRATDARWVELSGPYDARLLGAVAAVDELLADADVHGFADSARRASSSILP